MSDTALINQRKTVLPDHILLVDKPKGITSFDVIRILRPKLGIKKIGHAGTLDPLATGLMIIGTGPGTKLLKDFIILPKTYEAEILLGVKTTSGDLAGETIEEQNVTSLNSQRLHDAIMSMKGTHSFHVPAHSAVKVSGSPLYKRAHRGEKNIQTPLKEMTVHKITIQDIREEDGHTLIRATFNVSSGTYIRTLAEEIGKMLHVPATLSNLRRTNIGPYSIEDSIPLNNP